LRLTIRQITTKLMRGRKFRPAPHRQFFITRVVHSHLFTNQTNIKMKTIKNDYCIRMFVGADNNKPALTKVNLQDGYLYATNGYVLAKINADLCVHKYDSIEKYPNAEKVISEHTTIENKTVSVEALLNDLMKIECCFKPKLIDCEQCNGDGVCICEHCDSEHDCKECKGSGKVSGGEMELSSEHDCIVFDKKYKLQYLDLIIKTAVYTGIKEVEISNDEGTKGTLFSVGDFDILLMPRYRG
jgi:hypothetical protein